MTDLKNCIIKAIVFCLVGSLFAFIGIAIAMLVAHTSLIVGIFAGTTVFVFLMSFIWDILHDCDCIISPMSMKTLISVLFASAFCLSLAVFVTGYTTLEMAFILTVMFGTAVILGIKAQKPKSVPP